MEETIANATNICVKDLFVLEASGRLKVAGGNEDDLPLSEPNNQELLDRLEEAAEASSSPGSNDIVLQDFTSGAVLDLRPRGKGVNPHSPVEVRIHRLPLLQTLGHKEQAFMRERLKKEGGSVLGLSEDVMAMTVMATMSPEDRAELLGLRAKVVVVNQCDKARQLAQEFEAKRAQVAATVAAKQQPSQAQDV